MNHSSRGMLFGLGLLPALVFAAHPVDELAHLTAPPEKAESLGFRLTECPIALGSFSEIDRSKVVAHDELQRGMAEKMWEWRNYRVLGSDAICVELVRPVHEPLTRLRAAILTMVMNNVLPDGSVNKEEVRPWGIPLPGDEMMFNEILLIGKRADTTPVPAEPVIEAFD